MPRKSNYLLQGHDEEELHTRREQSESESQFQSDPGRSTMSTQVMQRTIAHPGQARPQDLLAVSRTYGNQAVMRLMAKARLERQAFNTTSTIQRVPFDMVQRDEEEEELGMADRGDGNVLDDNEVGYESPQIQEMASEPVELPELNTQDAIDETNRIKADLKKEKKNRALLKLGKMPLNLIKNLLIMPISALDQLTVVDLHVKDIINFFRKGWKTRATRVKETELSGTSEERSKNLKGTAKRKLGRSGLTGYIQGLKSHNMTYTSGPVKFDGPFGKYNPLRHMGMVNDKKINKSDKKIRDLNKELNKL